MQLAQLLSGEELADIGDLLPGADGGVEGGVPVQVVPDAVGLKILRDGHPVADGLEAVIVVVDAVVVDGLHDDVVLDVDIEIGGAELLEHLLHGEGHIACAAGEVDEVGDVLVKVLHEAGVDDAADLLVGDFVVVVPEEDGFDVALRHAE